MAISSYSNPIPEIIDGLLRGHQLGLQMQQAARADQEFKTQQAMHNQQMSMQDIMNQKWLQENTRPLGPGDTVQDYPKMQAPSMPISPGSSGATGGAPQGDLYNLPTSPGPTMPGQTFDYTRKAEKSRVVTVPDRFGNKRSGELLAPEEQQQRDIARRSAEYQAQEAEKVKAQIAAMGPLAQAKFRIDQQQALQQRESTLKLQGGGKATPPEFAAVGGTPGRMLTQAEYDDLLGKYQTATKPIIAPETSNIYQQQLPGMATPGAETVQPSAGAPGQPDQTTTTINVPGQLPAGPQAQTTPATTPGGLRLLKQGSVPEPTGEFGAYLKAELMKRGHTYQSALQNAPDLISSLTKGYKVETADPEIRAATLASKAASLATADLAQTLKQIQIGQAPTKEDAARMADHILNHELAPSQIAEIRGRGNGAMGIMIEREIAKKDPHFSWQQADADYTYSKSPALQSTLRYMDAAIGSMGRLQTAADTLNNGNIRSINSLTKLGKNQFNNVDLKRFQTDVTLVGDEIAKILQGGGTGSGTSDAKMRQAQEIFKDTDSPRAIATALREVQSIIGYRRQAMSRGTPYEGTGVSEALGAGTGGGASGTRPPLGSFERK